MSALTNPFASESSIFPDSDTLLSKLKSTLQFQIATVDHLTIS